MAACARNARTTYTTSKGYIPTAALVRSNTDERDVQRIYEMSLSDGVWKLWRDGELFSQRFTGKFSEDGKMITGRWEIAEDRKTWKTDFDLTYTKVQ